MFGNEQRPSISKLLQGLVTTFYKSSAAPEKTYALAGRLYLSRSGWILLTVPNAIVRGVFDAMDEPGLEMPPSGPDGSLNAHISVIRPEELEQVGGGDKVSERGHMFRYNLGPVKTVNPGGWPEMAKVWFIEVNSPELQNLRKSYGLSALPNDNKYKFHITIAVRRKRVLQNNDRKKVAGIPESFRDSADAAAQEANARDLREPASPGVLETGAKTAGELLPTDLSTLNKLAGFDIDPALAKEAKSLLMKSIHRQLQQPVQWQDDKGLSGNIGNYLSGIRDNFQQQVRELHGNADVAGLYNPNYGWERLQYMLENDLPPEIENPVDKLLYRWIR